MSERSSGELFLAFLLGGIVGGAMGVMLAPAAGKKTRRDLAGWIKRWLEEGADLYEDGRDTILEKARRMSPAGQSPKKAYEE
ncbi:MAG: YtxH domain-containing protein [Elusimicrobia bacterium]|nr:YtxH domain-containing protein [Elusimicrobiota bacterium]